MLTVSPYGVSSIDTIAREVRRHKSRAAASKYEEYNAATETETASAKAIVDPRAIWVSMKAPAAMMITAYMGRPR